VTSNPRATRRALLKVHKLTGSATRRHIRLPLGPQAEYGVQDLCRVLLYACENGTAVTWSGTHLRDRGLDLPDGDTVLRQFGRADWRELAKGFTRLHREPLIKAWRSGLLQGPVDIAFDFTDEPWHGEDLPFIVRGEADRGTTRFIRWASVSILADPVRFVAATAPVFPDTSKTEVIEFLLGELPPWLRFRRAFLDRGFYSVDVLTMLEENHIGYVVAARRTSRVKKAIRALRQKGKTSMRYTVRSLSDSIGTTLFFVEDEDGEVHAFVTNLPVKDAERLAQAYRKRWGIETAFRVKNGFRAKTCARTYPVRFALYMMAMALYNFWVFVNVLMVLALGSVPEKPRITVDDLRFGLLDLQFPGIR
jgi:putative transposase